MKKIKLPDTLVLIFSILILAAILTWIVPGGEYSRIKVGDRTQVDPESFHSVDHKPQGIFAVLMAPLRGFMAASEIIAFVLIVSGAFFVLKKTGAVDALIYKIVSFHKKYSVLQFFFIPTTMIIFSVFGSVFGMSEEILPFILLFVPLAISLGYDSITGVAIPFVGAGAGFAGAFINPFTIGIAWAIAELPPMSGLYYRLIIWAIITVVAIIFVMRYALKIKKQPQKSVMYELDEYWRTSHEAEDYSHFSRKDGLIIGIFALTIAVLIFGVITYEWFIPQIAALFLAMALIAGAVSHLSFSQVSKAFVEGAKELVQVAFIIALARSILVIMQDGLIIDSILHGMAELVGGAHPIVTAQMMFVVQSVINFLVPSGSGQAALVMPIMAPLSDLLGVTRQTAVLAFQMGDGFTNMIIPTSGVLMGVLGLAKIPFEKWFKWMWKLQVIFFVLALLLLIPPVLINWGPF